MCENVDLERDILLYLENKDENNEGFQKYQFADFINSTGLKDIIVLKHCDLLRQRGLINFNPHSAGNDIYYHYQVGPITAKGYDFIAGTRSNKHWEDIKKKILDKGIDVTLDSVLEYLPIFIKALLMNI